MRRHLERCLLLLVGHLAAAQSPQCATVVGGCNAGTVHDAVLKSALAKFESGIFYGGEDEVVMSSVLSDDGDLAMITYACQDGSAPPRLEGGAIRAR